MPVLFSNELRTDATACCLRYPDTILLWVVWHAPAACRSTAPAALADEEAAMTTACNCWVAQAHNADAADSGCLK
mgnify:CR=1 FL=1